MSNSKRVLKLCKHLWSYILPLIALSWWMPAVNAQPQPGQYPAGAVGQMKAPISPPPGVYLENGTLLFFSNQFFDSNGNAVSSELNVISNRTAALWNTGIKIFNGDYILAIAIPIGNFAPRVSGNQEPALGLGDIYLQPVGVGWHFGDFHLTTSYNAIAPTGRFQAGSNSNTGRGFWSHLLTVGTGYLSQDKLPWNAMVQVRYELPGTQSGTGVTPGQALILEYGVGKAITETVDLGVVGYATWQTTDQQGGALLDDPSRYRYFGVGPEVQVKIPNWNMFISTRLYFDFGSRNITQGTFGVVSLNFTF